MGRIYSKADKQPEQRDEAGNLIPNQEPPKLRYIYERWNKCINTAQFPDIINWMASAVESSEAAVHECDQRIVQAKEELVRIAEERRQAQLAALAKKNEKTNNKKKGKSNDTEVPVVDPPKEVLKSKDEEEQREYVLDDPQDFVDKL